MSILAQPDNVNDILTKVHEDLLRIKEQLNSSENGTIDLSAIQAVIERTEGNIKERSEQLLNNINNAVSTLPPLEEQTSASFTPYIETTWDLQVALGTKHPTKSVQDIPRLKNRSGSAALTNKYEFSPAEKLRLKMAQKALFNPQNETTRKVMNENYGIQLPVLNSQRPNKAAPQKLILGSTVEPLAVLPAANRKDPQLAPPPITEDDARLGIISLLQRGLIPPGSDLTLDPSPVKHKLALIHSSEEKRSERLAIADGSSANLAGVKLDTSIKGESTKGESYADTEAGDSQLRIPAKQRSIHIPKAAVSQRTFELQLNPVPPPTTPNVLGESKAGHHRFPIQNGYTRESSAEYINFHQHYILSWGPIISLLRKLEKLMQDYAVPVAFVHGDKLAQLALEFQLELQPSVQDLLTVVANREDVEALISQPGRKFKGQNGQTKAATKIQSSYRMHKQRKLYLEYRHRKWAAGVIALTWIMNVKMSTMKRQLQVTRQRELESFRERAKAFALSWHRIKRSRRVVIHIPSLGYSQKVRDTISEFGTIQNAQMARLCEIQDPNVDVIYVSPVPINDECMQYYAKLLALKPAIDSGNVDDQNDLSNRYKIVIPEAIKSFPTHRMCLSTHLKYSPKALKRIRSLVHGREAYIVTGMPHIDDLSVAEFLKIPILGAEPDVAHLYSTKSGSKRIFQSASVKVPPGEYDIYTFPQLHDSLALLITNNLDVRTWLFKMDHEFDGRGTAYCHVADHLRCYMWARRECERYGEKWSQKWAQEPVFNKIHSELPGILDNHCTAVNGSVYPSWKHFLNAFLSRGGVVEATPPSDSVTALTVDMLIEPDGKIEVISSGDQIHADSPYRCWGISMPQCSVEPEELNSVCMRLAEACKARGVVGYFSVDLLTFISPKTGEQDIWATDLNLHYNDSTAMNSLIKFITNGTLNVKDHMLTIPLPPQESRRRRKRKQSVEDELPPTPDRYAVYSTKLLHSNLTVVHYSVFFQMCRAHGIGYDVKEKQGTVFTLIDSFNRENLGMLTIGDNLQGVLATYARNLSCIHQEISAPNMQGVTNFKTAIEDIETILGTTIQNANEVDEDESSEL